MVGSGSFRSTESSHVTRLTLFPSTRGRSFFVSLSGLLKNSLPSLGLDVSEKLGLVLKGVAGGVRREETVMMGDDVIAGVAIGVRRDGLGAALAAGWPPVVKGKLVEAVDTGLQCVLEVALPVGNRLDTVSGWRGL